MQPGDLLVFYTDGIIECTGPARTRFGVERLIETLVARAEQSVAEILEGVLSAVFAFSGGRPQSDDMTAVVLKVCAEGCR
jgi:sigma-B regulation protein RsbU (phosphoserine phosphatase)